MKHSHQWNIENWKCWNSIKSVMTIMGTNPHNLFTLSINQGFWEVSVKGIKYCKWLILHDCSVLFRTIARTIFRPKELNILVDLLNWHFWSAVNYKKDMYVIVLNILKCLNLACVIYVYCASRTIPPWNIAWLIFAKIVWN